MQQIEEEEQSTINHKKIAANINCSMAVSEDGDLMIWGKNNYFGEQIKQLPTKMGLVDQYLYYKVVHITVGLNHAAIILEDQIQKLVKEREFKPSISAIVAEQARRLKETVGIDEAFIKYYKQKQKRYVDAEEFREFYQNDRTMKTIQYSQEQKNLMLVGVEKSRMNQFELAFYEKEKKAIDLLLYYQLLSQDQRQGYLSIIWGQTSKGRLGITGEEYAMYKEKIENKNKSVEFISKSRQLHQSKLSNDALTGLPQNIIMGFIPMKQEFVKIVCGHHHTMAIDGEGILYVWGMGSQGCLGTGRIDDIETPFPLILDAQNIVEIAAGAFHSLALSEDGRVYGWGVNVRGQIGLGSVENQLLPQEVRFFPNKKIIPKKLFAGDQHSACITDSQELYTWGNGDYYRLGHGMLIDEWEPKKIEILQDVYVLDVALGTIHSLCVTNEGFVYSWGSCKDGILGMGNQQTKDQMLPLRVGVMSQSFKETTFFQVAAGTAHSLGMSQKGQIFSWGLNKNGVLGIKSNTQDICNIPNRIDWFQDKEQSQVDKVKFYNNEYEEKMEQEGNEQMATPDQIYFIKQAYKEIKKTVHSCHYRFAALGNRNSFMLDECGKLYGCGSNQFGMLCKDPTEKQKFAQFMPPKCNELFYEQSFTPIQIGFFKNTVVKFISCSYNHAIAITSKGSAYCWGQNASNQLGLGFGSDYVYVPIRLQGAIEQKKITMAICGEKFSAILTEQGEIWSFGTSEYGVLGHDEKNFYVIQEPRMINDIPKMIFIACSNQTMMAIDNKQQLYGWGNNTYGQVGLTLQRDEEDNLENNESTGRQQQASMQQLKNKLKTLKNAENYIIYQPKPIPVRALSGDAQIQQVACGLYHSLAITNTGELLSCGIAKSAGHQGYENDEGEDKLAQQYIDQFSSILNYASKKFKVISCHETHSLAVSVAGEILAWGSGIHDKVSKFITGEILKSKLITQIGFVACGSNHALLIQDSGIAYSWGLTNGGRLGVSYTKLKDLQKNSDDLPEKILDPEHIFCFACDETNISKQKQEQEKEKKKTSTRKGKGKKKKHAKKQSTNAEPLLDVSMDDEEILDETSFHSEEGEGFKVQDKLQKGILKQSQDCEVENLYIQDAEIEKRVQLVFKDASVAALQLQKQYTEISTKIAQIIDYRAKELALKNNAKVLKDLKFIVPQFIVKNVQLYECIFSSIYHHPCYMIKLIQSNQLNKFQLLRFIKIIYKNDLMESNNQSIILTLAIKAFEFEFLNAQSQLDFISELKLFKNSSVFLNIYIMFLQKDEKSVSFLMKMAYDLVEQCFFKKAYEILKNKYNNDDDRNQQKECQSKMKNYFNFHQEQLDPEDTQQKYKMLTELCYHYIRSILEYRDKCKIMGEDIISSHLMYLHNQIARIIRSKIISDELKKLKEIISIDQGDQLKSKLEKFSVKLDEKLGIFMNHLYYGSITYFILQLQEQVLRIPSEFRPFLGNDQNLRMVVNVIDRFFQNDPFLPSQYNSDLNKLITNKTIVIQNTKQNVLAIYEAYLSLLGYVQFSVENLNMVELIEESFQIVDRYMQIEIQDIIFLQQFYCQQIREHGKNAIQRFFVRGLKDPIFIILRHLEFREIQSNLFSTEILKRKVNLKLMLNPIMQLCKKTDGFKTMPEFSLFKCEQCQILTTVEYISNEKYRSFQQLQNNGWKCKLGHWNAQNVLDCEYKGCSEFITKEALQTSRMLKYYYREKDINIDLLIEILLNINKIAQGTLMFQYLTQIMSTNTVKKNARLSGVIESFITRVLPQAQDREERTQEQMDQLTKLFQKDYEIIHSKALLELDERQKHRALQITYNRLLKQLEMTTIDRRVDLNKTLQKMKVDMMILKQNMKIYRSYESQQPERPKAHPYGFFTSANMFQQQVLVKVTFQNREIPKILKNVKFYFFQQDDGGWHITLAYLQDSLLNLAVPCFDNIFPIELLLYVVKIPIDQYLELRRMAKYRTQITFTSSTMEITFNIIKLIDVFNTLEARLIK